MKRRKTLRRERGRKRRDREERVIKNGREGGRKNVREMINRRLGRWKGGEKTKEWREMREGEEDVISEDEREEEREKKGRREGTKEERKGGKIVRNL